MKSKKPAPNTCKIAVMFGLSKGEGEWPEVGQMTRSELADPRRFCTFCLDLDEGIESAPETSSVKGCQVVYDGVTPVPSPHDPEEKYGLWIEDSVLHAKIRPIVIFELSPRPDKELFRRFVWGSNYTLHPSRQEEPFYAEDWNGYTGILDNRELAMWSEHLKKHSAYSGKMFTAARLSSGIKALSMSP